MDPSAEHEFEAFVAQSSRSLLRTAWLLTGDRGAAEDVVQTALERTAQRWTRLSGDPQGYARRIVVNLAHDSWRRQKRRPHVVAATHELTVRQEPSVADDSGALVERNALMQALRALPHRQRSVLVLRYFLDLDEATIAATLDISAGTVKSSASRALNRLRDSCPELALTYAPKD